MTFNSDSALLRQVADGSTEEEALGNTAAEGIPDLSGEWSRDGRMFAFTHQTDTDRRDIWSVVTGAPDGFRRLISTRFDERMPAFSPVDDRLAYVSDESGQDEVYAQAIPGPGPKWQVSIGGGTEPVWGSDGAHLYFRQLNRLLAVDMGPSAASRPGKPVVLFSGTFLESTRHAEYDVTPDGRLLMVQRPEEKPLTHLRVVVNWFDELRRAAPAP